MMTSCVAPRTCQIVHYVEMSYHNVMRFHNDESRGY